ncbi:hypothetical protein [Rubinisphaera margarita]|uniref:hypothetical protein n=1 Tax=Rubinisphaera margarita TaxID=2909586 RepID=UPI001EE8117D|nr:hypothetical protein [Rubinisphaera margarita]MCG6158067.1 hypothetical protein [Rubinisphaera margarita]
MRRFSPRPLIASALPIVFSLFVLLETDEAIIATQPAEKPVDWLIVREELDDVVWSEDELTFNARLDAFARKHLHSVYKPFNKGPFSYYLADDRHYSVSGCDELKIYSDGGYFSGKEVEVFLKKKLPAYAVIDSSGNVQGGRCDNAESAIFVLEDDFLIINFRKKTVLWQETSLGRHFGVPDDE